MRVNQVLTPSLRLPAPRRDDSPSLRKRVRWRENDPHVRGVAFTESSEEEHA